MGSEVGRELGKNEGIERVGLELGVFDGTLEGRRVGELVRLNALGACVTLKFDGKTEGE